MACCFSGNFNLSYKKRKKEQIGDPFVFLFQGWLYIASDGIEINPCYILFDKIHLNVFPLSDKCAFSLVSYKTC